MTFGEWFKKEYPLEKDAGLKADRRRVWNAAVNECLKAIRKADVSFTTVRRLKK